MKYLFVCGCPRSGTTALWRLMVSHPAIVLGIERFIFPATAKPFALDPSFYRKDRFFRYQAGDTHFPDLTGARRGDHYRKMKSRFSDASYVGDKIPTLYRNYDGLFQKFPGAKVIFVFRNIFDVASSYKTRLLDETDTWNRGVSESISDWNQSLDFTLKTQLKSPEQILAIEYESLFFGRQQMQHSARIILDYLGLDSAMDFRASLKNEITYSERLDEKRQVQLTSREKRQIMHNADFESYRKLLMSAEKRRAEVSLGDELGTAAVVSTGITVS
ncbi:MAG: sulfotransferase [Pseudomonadota bacterium]